MSGEAVSSHKYRLLWPYGLPMTAGVEEVKPDSSGRQEGDRGGLYMS